MNRELPDVQAGFRKGRGTKDQIKLHKMYGFSITGRQKIPPNFKLPVNSKQESTRKTSISALLTMPKPLTVWITINGGKF